MSLTQDVEGQVLTVAQSGLWSVSTGVATGKTIVMKTGAITTTAITADQVILTYTVTAGKTFYLEYLEINARLTTFAATNTNFGAPSLEIAAGNKVYTGDIFHSGVSNPIHLEFNEPIPVTTGTVIRIVCTPTAVTSFGWRANFGGFEK